MNILIWKIKNFYLWLFALKSNNRSLQIVFHFLNWGSASLSLKRKVCKMNCSLIFLVCEIWGQRLRSCLHRGGNNLSEGNKWVGTTVGCSSWILPTLQLLAALGKQPKQFLGFLSLITVSKGWSANPFNWMINTLEGVSSSVPLPWVVDHVSWKYFPIPSVSVLEAVSRLKKGYSKE